VADSARHRAHPPSSGSGTGGFLPSAAPRPIDATVAAAAFLGAWVVAQLVSSLIIAALHGSETTADAPFGVLAAGLVGAWMSYLVVMYVTSQRAGSGSFVADYGLQIAWIDLAGLAVGALAQLVLLRVVYLPLEALWPDTFTQDRLAENAQDLIDRAGGPSTWLLVVVVVFGAPIVEELFYRGLLQRPLAARFGEGPVVVAVAAIFALAHFRPVEIPGLFAFGLLLGAAALWSGRLGTSIMIHIGFNATALLLVS